MTKPTLLATAALLAVTALPAADALADGRRQSSLKDDVAVRHRRLLVKQRFEFAPLFESTINADFRHIVGGGAKLEYHFTDMVSFGAIGVGATAQAIAGANVQTWFGRILPERERRFVAPRALAIQFGLGSVLLVPVALLVRVGEQDWGVLIYAPAFIGGLIASLLFLRALRGLPRPGAVSAGRAASSGPLSTPVRRFLRTNIISALGAGFAPYLSVYAIVVLKQDAAYAILMAAIGSAAALVGAILIGNWLERGSASRLYRISLVVRGVGMASSALAGPWNPYAPIVLLVVIVIITVGFAAGMLSAQERVLRLAAPGESIRAQSAYGATTAGALAVGQLAGVVVLALLPVAYPTYVGIFIVTGAFRLVAAATADVGDDWNTATRIHHGEEMPAEPAFESQR